MFYPTSSADYVTWIRNEFLPLQLITPEVTILQQIENARRYWNTHSAFKVMDVYDYAPGVKRVQISPEFKGVVQVTPTKTTTWIWNDHPLWTLTGITVLDNVTTDLILMSEAFRNYRIYVGTDFRFVFQKSDDPKVGGYLYCINVPRGTQSVLAIGTKRLQENEFPKNEYINDFLLNYSKALVKQIEGNTLRKTAIIDTPIDGQQLYDEGREDMRELQEKVVKDSRWIVFARRR